MAKLRALRKDDEIAAIPTSEPVLVELEPTPTGFMPDNEPEPAKPDAAEQPDDGNEPDPAVKALQEQLDAAKAAEKIANDRLAASERDRNDAIKVATERGELATRSIAERDQSERDFINSALQAAQSERDAAKGVLQAAFASGDGASFAEAQSKVSRAEAKILNLEGAAADLAQRAQHEASQPRPQERPPQRQLSVTEAIEQDQNLLPKEKEWLKAHPELIADANANQELGVGYARAIRAGHRRGTDAYFTFMDQFLGYAKPDAGDDDADRGRNNQERQIVSAPVSRQAQSMSGNRTSSDQVYVSPEQREVARSMGLSDKAYARGLQRLEKAKREDPERYSSRRS